MPDPSVPDLIKIAAECRIALLRMIQAAGSGHPGGSLSAVDVMVSLFFEEMKRQPGNAEWEDRDRFILSKGHAAPALYAILAKQGSLPMEELSTLRKLGSRLQGHPDRKLLPFVEASTGSLGQGLSVAQGMALGLKKRNKKARVFCLIGDGEVQEGQIWEAAMSAAKFGLSNLIVFLDQNNGQLDGRVEEIMDLRPLADKWRAFRWAVQEIDGHDFAQIRKALEQARSESQRPSLIVARTIKGKGVSFMENVAHWHGIAPSEEQLRQAIAELEASTNGKPS